MMGTLPSETPADRPPGTTARPGADRLLWLTVPIAAAVAATSAFGLTAEGLYRGTPAWTTQAVAQDLADLVFVLPVLVVSAWLAARGSWRGWLVWLGALSYLVYTFVIYAFAVQHNRLFLAYVLVLGASLWALVGGLAATDWDGIKARFAADAPVRAIGLLLIVPAVLFTVLWLADEVPAALSGTVPQAVVDNGLATNPVHVIDLSAMLPAMAMAGIWAWRRRAIGYGLSVVLLVNVVLQDAAIATMMVFALRKGLPASPAMIGVFAVLAGVMAGALAWFLRATTPPEGSRRESSQAVSSTAP